MRPSPTEVREKDNLSVVARFRLALAGAVRPSSAVLRRKCLLDTIRPSRYLDEPLYP